MEIGEQGAWMGQKRYTRKGQKLAELLDAEPSATESDTVYPRWTFPDGNAVVLGQGSWRVT